MQRLTTYTIDRLDFTTYRLTHISSDGTVRTIDYHTMTDARYGLGRIMGVID